MHVVDGLEAVEVEEEEGDGTLGAAPTVERQLETVQPHGPVAEPGQRVLQRPAGEQSLRPLTFDRVVRGAQEGLDVRTALDQVVLRARSHRFQCEVAVRVAGHHDDGDVGGLPTQRQKALEPARVREADVEEDAVDGLPQRAPGGGQRLHPRHVDARRG